MIIAQVIESLAVAVGSGCIMGGLILFSAKTWLARVNQHIDNRELHLNPADPPPPASLITERHGQIKADIDVLHKRVDRVKDELGGQIDRSEKRLLEAISSAK